MQLNYSRLLSVRITYSNKFYQLIKVQKDLGLQKGAMYNTHRSLMRVITVFPRKSAHALVSVHPRISAYSYPSNFKHPSSSLNFLKSRYTWKTSFCRHFFFVSTSLQLNQYKRMISAPSIKYPPSNKHFPPPLLAENLNKRPLKLKLKASFSH